MRGASVGRYNLTVVRSQVPQAVSARRSCIPLTSVRGLLTASRIAVWLTSVEQSR